MDVFAFSVVVGVFCFFVFRGRAVVCFVDGFRSCVLSACATAV